MRGTRPTKPLGKFNAVDKFRVILPGNNNNRTPENSSCGARNLNDPEIISDEGIKCIISERPSQQFYLLTGEMQFHWLAEIPPTLAVFPPGIAIYVGHANFAKIVRNEKPAIQTYARL